MHMQRRGIELRLVIQNADTSKTDPVLIKTIARAHKWFDDLLSGKAKNIAAIAAKEKVDERYIAHRLPFAFLAPDIVEGIIAGNQPAYLTTEAMIKRVNIPLEWSEQRRVLGFH